MWKPTEQTMARICVSLVVLVVLALTCGLAVTKLNAARAEADTATSTNNLRQMVLAVNNVSCCTAAGVIPPAYGVFPGVEGKASFFFHLLPYIEQFDLYKEPKDALVKTYVVPLDRRNKGKDATISYASNATLLGINPNESPCLPASFGGRTSSIIVVMERSGLDGAHKWNNDKNYLGKPGTPPPFPQIGVEPAKYKDGSPQGFTEAGCKVGLGDGSVRTVGPKSPNGWKWACNPRDENKQPADW
jgi:hypothetical protein